jgi:hypothetical protein
MAVIGGDGGNSILMNGITIRSPIAGVAAGPPNTNLEAMSDHKF